MISSNVSPHDKLTNCLPRGARAATDIAHRNNNQMPAELKLFGSLFHQSRQHAQVGQLFLSTSNFLTARELKLSAWHKPLLMIYCTNREALYFTDSLV